MLIMLLFMPSLAPKARLFRRLSQRRYGSYKCFNLVVVSKWIWCLPQRAVPDQTMACVTSQQCVKAAGVGAGALDDGKWMIAGAIG
jgi:hypothetical protein